MASTPDPHTLISRREAIFRVSALFGGVALVGQAALLAGCEKEPVDLDTATGDGALFSDRDIALLGEIADTILPETSTPGAKAAGVGPFMALMVTDTYYPADQEVFRDGMVSLEAASRDRYGNDFLSASPQQRLELLQALDAEQLHYMQNRRDGQPAHYFRMMKELTLLGYFTSQIGCTQALRYVETPGRYDPCVPYKAGDRAWANHA